MGDPTAIWGRQISVLTHAWAFTLAVGVLVTAIHSFRSASDRVARQQAGWIVWGGGLALTPLLVLGAVSFVFPGTDRSLNWAVAAAGLGVFPASVAVAILRHRLWDIDLVLRRTMVTVGRGGGAACAAAICRGPVEQGRF